MAGGWSRDGAVQDQIDDSISDELARIKAAQPVGESLTHCIECGEPIPESGANWRRAFATASNVSANSTRNGPRAAGSTAGAQRTAS